MGAGAFSRSGSEKTQGVERILLGLVKLDT